MTTTFKPETPSKVKEWLEKSRIDKQRIRIFLGDTTTGADWMEEYDTIGMVGRSTGQMKTPLLLKNIRSTGGTAILDHCIVRIDTKDSKGNIVTVYQHPNYNQPKFTIQSNGEKGYPVGVYEIGSPMKNIANFTTKEKAQRWIDLISGKRWHL